MSDEPRKRRPTILGVEVPEHDREVIERRAREDERRAQERLRAQRPPPPERSYTPYDLRVVHRAERAPLPEMTPSKRSVFPRGIPSWALGLGYVATAVGSAVTGAIVVSATRAPSAKPAEVVRVDSETLARDRAQNAYLEGLHDDWLTKETVLLAFLCAQNSNVPPARGLECPDVTCKPQPVMRAGKIVPKQFACVVDVPWPTLRKPPKQ